MNEKLKPEKKNSKITNNDILVLITKSSVEILPLLVKPSFEFNKYLGKISKKFHQNELDLDELVNVLHILKEACSIRSKNCAKELRRLLEILIECKFLFIVVPCVINDCFREMREINLIMLLNNYIVVLCSILEHYSCPKIVDIFPFVQSFFDGIQMKDIKNKNKVLLNDSAESSKTRLEDVRHHFSYLKVLVKKQSECESNESDDIEFETFRNLSIVPRRNDIINCELPDLPMNIIKEPYQNVSHYLSVHFRLMREDMIRSYRECVHLCLNSMSLTQPQGEFNLYKSVQIGFPPEYSTEGVVYDVKITSSEKVDWTKKAILMPGSLICFTPDSFHSVVFASILSNPKSSSSNSREAYIKIKLEDDLYEDKLSSKKSYQIVEPNAYFESYKHVLNAIKGFSEKNFPLADFITYLDFKNPLPRYLKESNFKSFCLHECCEKKITDGSHPCKIFNPLDFSQWPSAEELNLDFQQFEAFRVALTNKVAVIQGPPGTGKTFIGVKIVRALLDNIPHKPIIISCLTNHALDQFLERILKYTKNVVRIGFQSQSNILKPHVLNNICKAIRKYHDSKNECDLDQTLKKSLELAEEFWRPCLIQRYAGKYDRDLQSLKKLCNEINTYLRLFCVCKEKYLDETSLNHIIPSVQKDELCEHTVTLSKRLISNLMEWLCESQEGVLYEQCQKYFNKFSSTISENPKNIYEARQVWDLSLHKRYQLFYSWRQACLKVLRERITELLKLYKEKMRICRTEIISNERLDILQRASIIGVTTTGAAKYKSLIMHCSPRILVVEEAAEVLESHIIAALVPSIEHMILIGDHKQLRPLPTDYDLSENYHLKVSMFERLFQNSSPSAILVTQHRMKPCIAKLLVPEIYDDLRNGEVVHQYEDIRGIESSLYFFNHNVSEDALLSGKSSSNEYESKLVVSLAKYLLAQSYSSENITILATYAAQVQLIGKWLKEENIEIYVTTVDNYQGEENEIILISFVKSNSSVIGFLKESNRVCVALSRAKKGMFCIGNFRLFASKNLLWRKIVEKMELSNMIGDSIPLLCHQHENVKYVKSPGNILLFLRTGCDQNCDYILNCGHECMRKCHFDDLDHNSYECVRPCERYVDEIEICPRMCFQPCKRQKHVIELPCGHNYTLRQRNSDPEVIKCKKEMSKLLPCGHVASLPCNVNINVFECKKLVSVSLPCGHEKKVFCSKQNDLQHTVCSETQMKNSSCGHIVEIPCSATLEDKDLPRFCIKICNSLLQCGHECFNSCRLCSETGIHGCCSSRCEERLLCGHKCSGFCGGPCVCKEECFLTCSHNKHCVNKCLRPCLKCEERCARRCKHARCDKLCFEKCSIKACLQSCEEILPCGHICCGLCGDPCPYLCRICHKNDFDSGNANTDQYVMLCDCKHIIEVNALTNHIDECLLALEWPCCPYCSVIIQKSCRYKTQLQRAKRICSEYYDMSEEIEDLKYFFHSMFSDVVPARFQDIHNSISRVLFQDKLTRDTIIILKSCISCLGKMIKINQKCLTNPDFLTGKHCKLFNAILLWIQNHLVFASYQQLSEVKAVVSKLYNKYCAN